MIRRSFFWRLFAGYALLVALVAVIFIAAVIPALRGAYESDTESSLASQATLLAGLVAGPVSDLADEGAEGPPAIMHPRASSLQPAIRSAGESAHTRLTVVLLDGTVIADSAEDPAVMANHANRPELLDARNKGYGSSIHYSRTLGYRLMYVARPVEVDGQMVGLVRTSLPLDEIDQRIFELMRRVILSALLALGVALVLGWFVGRRITQPLRQVTAAVSDLGRGDYSRRISINSDDEIGVLASTINHLGESLEERIAEIRSDRNKTLAILASMSEGVIAVDGEERILHLNQAAEHMLGVKAASSIGMHVWEAVRVTDICTLITRVVRGEESEDFEVRTSVVFGERELELHGTPMHGEQQQPGGAVLVIHDVTELRRLESIRTDFVSNVSHELKTPLTVITGLVESILHDPQMPDATRQSFLARVHGQSRRLNDLVQDLLSLSRAERLQPQGEHQTLDLRRALKDSASALEPLIEEKQLTLDLDVETGVLPVSADSESLRQIFDNLLSNACRYTAVGGRIGAKARREGDRVIVSISDTGIGIDEQQQERIFERFYRVDTARSREHGGTGLGLAIVKHVVQGLGGDVEIESEPGVGSVFTIGIPVAGEPE